MKYVKIKNGTGIELFPNPFKVTVSNPTDEMKAKLAGLFGWKEFIETPAPKYDEETQILTLSYKEENGKVVQVWEVVDLPEDEV